MINRKKTKMRTIDVLLFRPDICSIEEMYALLSHFLKQEEIRNEIYETKRANSN